MWSFVIIYWRKPWKLLASKLRSSRALEFSPKSNFALLWVLEGLFLELNFLQFVFWHKNILKPFQYKNITL